MAQTVTITDLSLWFGQQQVLKNISLYAQPREVTALIGPSGCGKTTLLRCVNRLHDLYSGAKILGKIMVGSDDIFDASIDPVELRRRVGMIFQKPNPFPNLSIFDNVASGLRLHGLAHGRAVGETGGSLPTQSGALGRSQRQPGAPQHHAFRRPATTIVHCPRPSRGA